MEFSYTVFFFSICLLGLASSAPVNEMSSFLKSVIGANSIKSGDIPSYFTYPVHVIETSPVTKRDVGDSETRHFVIQTTDEIMNITLHPNKKLLSRDFIVQQRNDNGDLETMNVSTKNCYYTGSVVGHSSSGVAVSMCSGKMRGFIEVGDDMYVMEPADENNDFSHVAYKMKRKPMKFEDGDALPCPTYKVENGYTKYYHNSVKHICNHHYQLFGSDKRECLPNGEWSGNAPICVKKNTLKKAVKIQDPQCSELTNPEQGTVKITKNDGGLFTAVYKCMPQYSISGDRLRYCSPTSGQWSGSTPRCLPTTMMDAYKNGLDTSEKENRISAQRESSTIELMVYVDAELQNDANQNGFSPIDHVLGIINIMARLYRDSTLKHQMDLTLKRLILEGVNGAARINIEQEVSSTLDTFCAYQQSINTPDDSNPLHFDHAILITNIDLCGNDGKGGCSTEVIGFSRIGGMCSQSSSCTINENSGFSTAFTLAHETGHNLGMQHDGTGNVCSNSWGIMAPSIGEEESFFWSSCSAGYLQTFLSSGIGICLEDTPAQGKFDEDATKLIGLEFNADEQCRAQYGPNAISCPFKFALDEICSRLWCQPNGGSCATNYIPPADGTSCGSTNICVQGQCIDGSAIIQSHQ